jgi:hypothetical protein
MRANDCCLARRGHWRSLEELPLSAHLRRPLTDYQALVLRPCASPCAGPDVGLGASVSLSERVGAELEHRRSDRPPSPDHSPPMIRGDARRSRPVISQIARPRQPRARAGLSGGFEGMGHGACFERESRPVAGFESGPVTASKRGRGRSDAASMGESVPDAARERETAAGFKREGEGAASPDCDPEIVREREPVAVLRAGAWAGAGA